MNCYATCQKRAPGCAGGSLLNRFLLLPGSRHRSGLALLFPRTSRWRRDKAPEEINTLEDLKKMLALYGK